jgi:hypothetical protein
MRISACKKPSKLVLLRAFLYHAFTGKPDKDPSQQML